MRHNWVLLLRSCFVVGLASQEAAAMPRLFLGVGAERMLNLLLVGMRCNS